LSSHTLKPPGTDLMLYGMELYNIHRDYFLQIMYNG
jgi:hypothetical protein